jgi:alpha-tubulin suppressor-like RCC1 family protein
MVRRLSLLILALVVATIALPARAGAGGEPALSASWQFTCRVTAAATAQCWGGNSDGQLGNGTTLSSTVPDDVCASSGCPPLLSGVQAVATGRYHACALLAAGGVQCWGSNTNGQLGDGTSDDSSLPVPVTGLSSGVASITGGSFHTCAVMTGGGAKCWGGNAYGQLGNDTHVESNVPVDVCASNGCPALLSGVASIAALRYHTCAVLQSGGVKCWGDNVDGQLGTGNTTSADAPVDVCAPAGCPALLTGATAVSVGMHHTCASTASAVYCWGLNDSGQLGAGSIGGASSLPVAVTGLTQTAALSAGHFHACAVVTSGAVKCWGSNENGQLGNGGSANSGTPVSVCQVQSCSGTLSGALTVSGGFQHTCAATATDTLCWGANESGQLGSGSTVGSALPLVVGGQGVGGPSELIAAQTGARLAFWSMQTAALMVCALAALALRQTTRL